MVQFKILSGSKAGASWGTRRFPVRVGRSPEAHLQVPELGVWEQHLRIDYSHAEGFLLQAEPNAPTRVNGETVERVRLRNGDLVELGGVKLRFWLAPTRQRGLGVRETLTWSLLAALSFGQVALIYWLLR